MRPGSLSWLPVAGVIALGAFVAGRLFASSPEPAGVSDLPGSEIARLDVRWVAPYVATFGPGIAGKGGARTVWYAEDGSVLRDVEGAGDGFVAVPTKDGGSVVRGTLSDWSIALPPPPPGPDVYELTFAVSADGRTFVRQQVAPDGTTSADVWLDGRFRGRAGPVAQWRGQRVCVSDDGSVALQGGPPAGEKGSRVLVLAPRARGQFEAPCGTADLVESVAPAGRGALIRRARAEADDSFLFASPAGLRPLDLGPTPRVETWVPGTSKAVVSCGPDAAPRLRLVDLETGKLMWDVEDQALGGKRSRPGVAVEGDLVLLSGLDAHAVGAVSHWRRRVDALDLATGKRVAAWRSIDRGPIGYDEAAVFARRTGRLFLVCRGEFAPVPIADVRAKANGWE